MYNNAYMTMLDNIMTRLNDNVMTMLDNVMTMVLDLLYSVSKEEHLFLFSRKSETFASELIL